MNKLKADSVGWPIILASLLIGLALFSIFINPHLFPWDERFHALVAYNLSLNPQFPMLYREMPLEYFDSSLWYKSEAWLHKPPLFSYQMAFWIRLLGAKVWVVRLNSLFMFLAMSLAFYKLARLHQAGRLQSSLLVAIFSFSPILFTLISGRMGMDHNDLNFLGHIALSFFFLERFRLKRKLSDAILMGLFCAAAVLSKWLPGLLAFLSLGLFALQASLTKDTNAKLLWQGFALALFCTILITASWHLYACSQYPQEWAHSMAYNSQHFSSALENHGQAWYFHLKVWLSYLSLPLLFALIALVFAPNKSSSIYLISFVFVLLFFSLAKTKLPAYSIIGLVPLYLIGLKLHASRPKLAKGAGIALSVIAIGLSVLQVTNLYKRSLNDPEKKVFGFYTELASQLPERTLLFNLPALQYPQAMFYTGALAFDYLPELNELRRLKKEGYEIILFSSDQKRLNESEYKGFKIVEYNP